MLFRLICTHELVSWYASALCEQVLNNDRGVLRLQKNVRGNARLGCGVFCCLHVRQCLIIVLIVVLLNVLTFVSH